VKYDADGRVERFKARLVARGFSQREGLDFEDTFAPVIRLESLRILLVFALAAMYGLTAHLDATIAYVRSQIDKQIFMEIPEGVKPDEPGQACELLPSLYGLKQSAHLWQQKVEKFVTSKGFRQSTADPGVFINDRGIIIAVYVDILAFGKNVKDIDSTKDMLKKCHLMKDSGRVSKILGIRVTWLPDGSIRLDQEAYGHSIFEEFGMLNCKPQELPISPSTNLTDETSPKLEGFGIL
jgi:Reverse transcriptase (RNA-dependent DNA polymerase)